MGDRNLVKPAESSEVGTFHAGPACDCFEEERRKMDAAHSHLQFSPCPSPSNSTSKAISPPLGRIHSEENGQHDARSCSATANCQKTASHPDSGFSSWIGIADNSRIRSSPKTRRPGSVNRMSPSLASLIEDPADRNVEQPLFPYLVDVMPRVELVNTELSDTMFVRSPGDLDVQPTCDVTQAGTESLNSPTGAGENECGRRPTETTFCPIASYNDLAGKVSLVEETSSSWLEGRDDEAGVLTPQHCLPVVTGANHQATATCYFRPGTPMSTSVEVSSSEDACQSSRPSCHGDGDGDDEAESPMRPMTTATVAIACPGRRSVPRRRRLRGQCRCSTGNLMNPEGRPATCRHLHPAAKESDDSSDTERVGQSPLSTANPAYARHIGTPSSAFSRRATTFSLANRPAVSPRLLAGDFIGGVDYSDTWYWPIRGSSGHGLRCASVPLGRPETAAPLSPFYGVTTTVLRLHHHNHHHHQQQQQYNNNHQHQQYQNHHHQQQQQQRTQPEMPTTGGSSWVRHTLAHRRRGRINSASFSSHQLRHSHRLSAFAHRMAGVGDELFDGPFRNGRHSLPNDQSLIGGASLDSGGHWRMSGFSLASLVTAPLDCVHHLIRMAASSLSGNSPSNASGGGLPDMISPLGNGLGRRVVDIGQENEPSRMGGQRICSDTVVPMVSNSGWVRTPRRGRRDISPHGLISSGSSRMPPSRGTRSGSPENIFTFDHE